MNLSISRLPANTLYGIDNIIFSDKIQDSNGNEFFKNLNIIGGINMNKDDMDIDKKGERLKEFGSKKLFITAMTLIAFLLILVVGLNILFDNKELTMEGIITNVDFSPGSFLVPRTVIITFENGDIIQFRNTGEATFRLGVKHIIVYKKTFNFYRIINVKRVYELKTP